MSQNHYSCSRQGISPGWSDTYQGGLRCQWIDATSINTSVSIHTNELSSNLNPDGFLCEGIPHNSSWLPTDFKTTCCSGSKCCGDTPLTTCCGGPPVEKQECTSWKGAADDNLSKINVPIPLDGEGQITAQCANQSGKWGEKRDCGFRLHPQRKMLSCGVADANATLTNVTVSSFFQIIRICEASIVLNSCIACTWNASLATITIQQGQSPKNIPFKRTSKRDSQEIGGKFCIYIAPLFEELDHDPNFVQWLSIE